MSCGPPQLQDIGRHSAEYVYMYTCIYMHIYAFSQEQQDSDWWSSWPRIDAIICSTGMSVSCIGSLFKNPCKQAGVYFDQ